MNPEERIAHQAQLEAYRDVERELQLEYGDLKDRRDREGGKALSDRIGGFVLALTIVQYLIAEHEAKED